MSDKIGVLRFSDRLYARRALVLLPAWAAVRQSELG
jgi:hypothetical protein